MSQMAPEAPAPARRENVFTRRIGPLPMWVWLIIVGGGIVAYSLWKRQTAGATSTGSSGTSAADVPQFVNQTYTTVTAPVSTPPSPPPKYPGIFHPPGPKIPQPTSNWPNGRQPPPTGPGGGLRTERLRNRGNIEQIAKRNGIDVEDLLEANPELAKYKGTRKQLPIGTVVRIPSAAA